MCEAALTGILKPVRYCQLDVTGLITHRIGVDDHVSGFEAMKSGNSGKVAMDW